MKTILNMFEYINYIKFSLRFVKWILKITMYCLIVYIDINIRINKIWSKIIYASNTYEFYVVREIMTKMFVKGRD